MRRGAFLVQDILMTHEWVPQTPVELRRHASKLRQLAAYVRRADVAQHLEEHAAKLFAEAELKRIAADR